MFDTSSYMFQNVWEFGKFGSYIFIIFAAKMFLLTEIKSQFIQAQLWHDINID